MTNATTLKTPRVTHAELLVAYADKFKAPQRSDLALRDEQISLEVAGASPNPAPELGDEPEQRARELLNGFAPAPRAAGSDGRLHQVLTERRAISIATDMLAQTEFQTRALAVAQVIEERQADWTEITRRRAKALLELRSANRDASKFRADVMRFAVSPHTGLVCDWIGGIFATEFAPVADRSLNGQGFLEACVSAGVITNKEFNS
jgi:hypothetical protein